MIIQMVLLIGLLPQATGTYHASSFPTNDNNNASTSSSAVTTVPLISFQNRLMTSVKLGDGSERLFLVDNGVYYTILDSELVDKDNFEQISEEYVNCAGKKVVPLQIGIVSSLQLGNLHLRNEKVALSPLLKYISRKINRRIHGVIGMKLMCRHLTTFDFSEQIMILKPYTSEMYMTLMSRPDTIVLPFRMDTWFKDNIHIFAIEIVINGVAIDAVVDLGFQGGLLTTRDPREIGLMPGYGRSRFFVSISGFNGSGWKTEARNINVGSHALESVPVTMFEANNPPEFTMIGIDFLKRFDFTIDYRNQLMILHPHHPG